MNARNKNLFSIVFPLNGNQAAGGLFVKQAMAKSKRRTSIKKYNEEKDKFSELNDLGSAVNQML